MKRSLFVLMFVVLLINCTGSCFAQYGRWYRGGGWGYGYGGYWGGDGSTPYSNAVRAEASMAVAQGMAAREYAQAAIAQEQARSAYIDNQQKYTTMRRQFHEAMAAKEQQRVDEAKARAAQRPAPKPKTERYPRLSSDQLDPVTGQIQWPDTLMGPEYAEDRKVIEDALKTQAEVGPNDRTASIIYDAAHRMMTTRSKDVISLGSQRYAACRKFLNSLAMEGQHAMEEVK